MSIDYFAPTSLRQRLKFVTLTGVGPGVSFDSLCELTRRHPYVEFGVHYNTALQGHGRFPSIEWIHSLVDASRNEPGLNLALHVFGRDVASFIKNDAEKYICELADSFPRIQLNLMKPAFPHEEVSELLERFPGKTMIFHHHQAGFPGSRIGSRDALIDWSDTFPNYSGVANITPDVTGYVGDLQPSTLGEQIRFIERATVGAPFWIGMGSCLRNESNEFDLSLAEQALAAVELALFKDDRLRMDTGLSASRKASRASARGAADAQFA